MPRSVTHRHVQHGPGPAGPSPSSIPVSREREGSALARRPAGAAPAAALAACLALAACGGPVGLDGEPVPQPLSYRDTAYTLWRGTSAAKTFVHHVSARCLLDGVVGGAAMLVDKGSGRVVIAGDRDELLAIDIIPLGLGRTRLRFSGPAIEDAATRARIMAEIDRAASTGETACPMLPRT